MTMDGAKDDTKGKTQSAEEGRFMWCDSPCSNVMVVCTTGFSKVQWHSNQPIAGFRLIDVRFLPMRHGCLGGRKGTASIFSAPLCWYVTLLPQKGPPPLMLPKLATCLYLEWVRYG